MADFPIGRAPDKSERGRVREPAIQQTWKSALRFGCNKSGSILTLLALPILLGGCVTKSNAKARANAAYAAGQQQGIGQTAEARRVNIRFIGPVRQFEVPWQDGLTLSQAIVTAGYTDARDPSVIWLIRQRERVAVSPRDLLAGKDVPLEPGDTVMMQP